MRKIKFKELSLEDFQPYGHYAKMINPKTVKIGAEPIEFFRDMVPLKLGQSNIAMFSVNRVTKRKQVIDMTEHHNYCGEGILPLDGDILIHVGPATPGGMIPANEIEVFHVFKGTFVALNPGVWHHASFPYGCDYVNVLIVLPERTYVNDCHVFTLPEQDQIEIIKLGE